MSNIFIIATNSQNLANEIADSISVAGDSNFEILMAAGAVCLGLVVLCKLFQLGSDWARAASSGGTPRSVIDGNAEEYLHAQGFHGPWGEHASDPTDVRNYPNDDEKPDYLK